MPKPANVEDLRSELLEAYEWIKADPRRHNQVKEMANTAGKIIGTVKLQLEYSMLRQEKPCIDFLGGDAGMDKLLPAGEAKQLKPAAK